VLPRLRAAAHALHEGGDEEEGGSMRDGFVVHGAEGVIGGAIGTLLVKETMALGRRLPEKLKPPAVSRDPGDFLLSRFEALRGRPLPWNVHDRIASGLGWAYGIGWGGLLGLAVAGLRTKTVPRTLLAGAGMGAVVWAVGYVGWLPSTGLTPPIHRQGASHVAVSLASHVLYGVAAAVPIAVIDRARQKRQPWWKKLATTVIR
jgi:hypothetical protein